MAPEWAPDPKNHENSQNNYDFVSTFYMQFCSFLRQTFPAWAGLPAHTVVANCIRRLLQVGAAMARRNIRRTPAGGAGRDRITALLLPNMNVPHRPSLPPHAIPKVDQKSIKNQTLTKCQTVCQSCP